jgi:hypothetical protein
MSASLQLFAAFRGATIREDSAAAFELLVDLREVGY